MLGALKTALWFEERKQKFDWVLDEGSPIAENQVKGIDTSLALVSIEEKGNLSLNLTVEQQPGHASRPPKIQAAAILARALCRIDKKPFPYRLSPTVLAFFCSIGRLISGVQGFVMRHARFFSIVFKSLFFKLAAVSPTTEAMLKTTVAMTMLEGSSADNVMPSQVRAVINLRLLYPWTIEAATAFIKKAINDKRVQISYYEPGSNPVPAPRYLNLNTEDGWLKIQSVIAQVWPDVPLMPFIMVAISDSRHYQKLSNNIFRFSPQKLDADELNRIHGHDERISEKNLHNELSFYSKLMRLL
jgi:carboxypeptidase PM20D1